MSTTVELGRMRDQRDAAVAELAGLRARVEVLAKEIGDEICEWECNFEHAEAIRNLLDADS